MRFGLALALSTQLLFASQLPAPPRVAIPRLERAPSMASDADLSSWQGALVVDSFGLIMPDDKGPNRWPTRAFMGWGPDGLYVAVECRDPEPSQVRAWRHRRDEFSDVDFVGLDLDPSGKGQSCLRLLATPLGGQMDGIVTDNTGEDYSYDLLWDSAGARTEWGYLVKFRVPYTSLRRLPGDWGVRVLRIIPRERRYGIAWPPMSRDVQCDICQMAKASGAPVEKAGSPFLVIPFATARREESLEAGPGSRDLHRLGLDLRYSGTAVTLDGTYRPDFSNVEADVDPLQVNSRFKVLYPEKRPFFLEGMDLLGVQGAQRQFFSRAILDPLYGVKASGQAAWASWSLLQARDAAGGDALASDGAFGTEGRATRDTAAAARFNFDGRGSGLGLVATDKTLVGGGPAWGNSSGIYLNQWLGSDFQFIGSRVEAHSRLPQADGSLRDQRGSASSAELDWTRRSWSGWILSQATSPDLVLLSGFTSLQGFHHETGAFGWNERWNQGFWSQAQVRVRAYSYTWWDRSPMERASGLTGYLETAGRWSLNWTWDPAGRAFAQGRDLAIRNLLLKLGWKRHAQALAWLEGRLARTPDLDTGDPATLRSLALGSDGNAGALAYSVSLRQTTLDREADGLRLVRARLVNASGGFQFPASIYLRVQAFVVRYEGRAPATLDKYLKVLGGWQPNAFTHAYLGWSGRARRDPLSALPTEQVTDRGLFAKFAYAFQF